MTEQAEIIIEVKHLKGGYGSQVILADVNLQVKRGEVLGIVGRSGSGKSTLIVSLEYVNPNEYPALRVPWTPHHVYIPSAPSQMSEIMAGLDQTLRNIAKMDFARIGDQLERDLVAGEALLKHFDQANIAGLSTNADALLSNLRKLSSQITTFIGDTNAPLDRATLQKVSADADKALVELQVSMRQINQLLANFDVGSLNETLANLRRTSEGLEETVTKVEQYPSVLLFGKPPPPAKSVQRTSR